MTKNQLISAIATLSEELKIKTSVRGLNVEKLTALHADLTTKLSLSESNSDESNSDESNSDESNSDESNSDESNSAESNSDESNNDESKLSSKVILEFTGPYRQFANGDIAGFNADTAKNILKLKPPVAVEYQEETTEE
jgi:hypothetical protein